MKQVDLFPILFAALLLVTMNGCQPTVYLMPTPEALTSGKHDPFSTNPEAEFGNRNHVAYATNRLPVGSDDNRKYLTLFDNKLRLGVARVRIGGENDSWEALRVVSTTGEREGGIPLTLENAVELAVVPGEPRSDELSPEAQAFFDLLNDAIDRSMVPDLTLYVHGANNNFYRASAQASQFRHFTGNNSVVMVYAWPSAESILRYAVDVENAKKTVPVFARLLELLAEHSKARYIHILAYSAGPQILSPALAHLRRQHEGEDIQQLKDRLRLGEIYYAAPDVDFKVFFEDMATYIDLPEHVTLALNPNDSVLAFSAYHHGVSRAGRPDDIELTEEETRWVLDATRHLPFDVIWVEPELMPGMKKGAHDFWYSHPWVSTDILIQFLSQARPADRGLEVYENENQARIWYFPPDYPERITPVIERLQAEDAENGPGGGSSKPAR